MNCCKDTLVLFINKQQQLNCCKDKLVLFISKQQQINCCKDKLVKLVLSSSLLLLLLFNDNKMKMARKPGKKQKENLVGCTDEKKKILKMKRIYKRSIKRR